MRSHLINSNSETDHYEKLTISSRSTNKLSVPLNSGGGTKTTSNTPACFEAAGYGLRENPKKTWRIADLSKDTSSLPCKSCKECGKGFQSWKALFGHMKSHSDQKDRASNSLEEQDSWTNGNEKVVMDSQSDNETTAPNPRRRRSRRRTRYLGVTTTSSSFSIPNNTSSSISVSETEQEQQEEIAMCLMMLSRDAGHWGGGLKSVDESCDNSSEFLEEAPLPSNYKTSQVTIADAENSSLCHGKLEAQKLKKLNAKGVCASGFISKKLSRMKQTEVASIDGFSKKDKIKKSKVVDEKVDNLDSESYLRKEANQFDEASLGSNKFNSSKRKIVQGGNYDPEMRSDSLKRLTNEAHKRSRFECTTCNKIFHSYQALGGHRASHKKIKGCFASKIESSENSIETDVSREPIVTAESNPSKNCKIESSIIDQEMADQTSARSSKRSKGHECPICLKVFASGQALGGHKRSHLIGGGGSERKHNQTIVVQKPIPEIRDFLDLNLPAPVEEDSNGGGHVASLKPWWVGSCSHKHEGLVGLISN